MAALNTCRILALAAAATAIYASPPANASPAAPPPGATTPVAESVDAQYQHATHLMERGSNFNTAIANLRAALKSDPQNAGYHSALGCALVDRAASLAYAASKIEQYGMFHEHYVRDFARWQTAQQGDTKAIDEDPETARMEAQLSRLAAPSPGAQNAAEEARNRAYLETMIADRKRLEAEYVKRFSPGSAQPVEPVLRTKDDGRGFKMTADAAKAAIDALVRESKSEFARAEDLATNAQEKARILEIDVWAQLVMRRRLSTPGRNRVPYDRAPLREALQTALSLDGNSVQCVRAAADATIEMADLPVRPSPDELREAIALYRKALLLERRDNLHINARIFVLLEGGQITQSLNSSPESQSALQTAIQADPQNAFLRYIQAAMRLAETQPATSASAPQSAPGPDARMIVESGNTLPKISSLLYSEGVPADLAVAWNYGYYEGSQPLFIVAPLATKLCRLASSALQAGDPAEAERTLLAVVAMGKKVRDAPTLFPGGLGSLMLGDSQVLKAGYTGLTTLYRATNRENDARTASLAAADVAADAKATYDAWQADFQFGFVDE